MAMTKKQLKVYSMLSGGASIDGSLIEELICDHEKSAKLLLEKYKRYQAEDLPIDERLFSDSDKCNNKLKNDFRGIIVDQVVGYLFGKAITYQVDKNKYTNQDAQYKKLTEKVSDFLIRNSMEDLDMELGKKVAICGYAARLAYIDPEGLACLMNIDPWAIILLEDDREQVKYALRYFNSYDEKGNEIIVAEWYDEINILTFKKSPEHGKFTLESTNPHLFDNTPVVKFKNNDEEQGDFDKVETLIDSYDRTLSDSQNEIEEFRQAYMVFENAEISQEVKTQAKNTGAFSLPEDSKAYFLVKNVNTEFYSEQKKTLSDNIYNFSKSVDMSDEKFSGSAQTGESRRWKLINLENKAIVKQNKMTKALRAQFKLICGVMNKKELDLKLDYLEIFFEFHRSLPQELLYLADVSQKFIGTISDRTRLSLMPFVDDVDYELDVMEEEGLLNPDLLKEGLTEVGKEGSLDE